MLQSPSQQQQHHHQPPPPQLSPSPSSPSSSSPSSSLSSYEELAVIGEGTFGRVTKVRRRADGAVFVWKELCYGGMSEREKTQLVAGTRQSHSINDLNNIYRAIYSLCLFKFLNSTTIVLIRYVFGRSSSSLFKRVFASPAEVNILRELDHPHIVRYHDRIIDRERRRIFIVMEYCDAGDLTSLIKYYSRPNANGGATAASRARPNPLYAAPATATATACLPEPLVWRVLAHVAAALQSCHSRPTGTAVLHRDLKPSNILLAVAATPPNSSSNISSNGAAHTDDSAAKSAARAAATHELISRDHGAVAAKLADFGLARVLASAADSARTHVGTPYYMSPEQCLGRSYGAKADVWALGCLVYEMCTGAPPFHALTQYALAAKIQRGRYAPLGDAYSRALAAAAARMLVVDATKRASVAEVLAISQVAEVLTPPTLPTPLTPPAPLKPTTLLTAKGTYSHDAGNNKGFASPSSDGGKTLAAGDERTVLSYEQRALTSREQVLLQREQSAAAQDAVVTLASNENAKENAKEGAPPKQKHVSSLLSPAPTHRGRDDITATNSVSTTIVNTDIHAASDDGGVNAAVVDETHTTGSILQHATTQPSPLLAEAQAPLPSPTLSSSPAAAAAAAAAAALESATSVTTQLVMLAQKEAQLKALERELSRKSAEVELKLSALAQREALLAHNEASLAQGQAALAKSQAALAQNQAALAQNQAACKESLAAVEKSQAASDQRQAALRERESAVAAREAAVQLKEKEAAARTTMIAPAMNSFAPVSSEQL